MLQQLDPSKLSKEELFNIILEEGNRAYHLLIQTADMSSKYDELAKEYQLPKVPLSQDFLKQQQYALFKLFVYAS